MHWLRHDIVCIVLLSEQVVVTVRYGTDTWRLADVQTTLTRDPQLDENCINFGEDIKSYVSTFWPPKCKKLRHITVDVYCYSQNVIQRYIHLGPVKVCGEKFLIIDNFYVWPQHVIFLSFAKSRKVTNTFLMSVRLSSWKNSAPTGRIFIKFVILWNQWANPVLIDIPNTEHARIFNFNVVELDHQHSEGQVTTVNSLEASSSSEYSNNSNF